MLNLYNAEIEALSLHRTGNKSRNEKVFLSENPYKPDAEFAPLLKEFFLKPFREKEESYFQFSHEVDLTYNTIYEICRSTFANPETLHRNSKLITAHLWEQSNHPHIKSGEVFVAYLKNLNVDNTIVDAIGIFKAEVMSDFLETQQNETDHDLEIYLKSGISLDKLDKGCLIFNLNAEDGYKVLCVDQNRYDSRYWLEHFLSVDICHDEHFHTKKYLKFVQGFAKDVLLPAEDKKEEVMFLNRSVNFFQKNDVFEESAFVAEVLDNPDLLPQFNIYKSDNGPKWSIEDVTTFPISPTGLKEAAKSFTKTIKLDTNVSITMDFINPESADKFIEKGWDEEKQMYYYLVYYNTESKR